MTGHSPNASTSTAIKSRPNPTVHHFRCEGCRPMTQDALIASLSLGERYGTYLNVYHQDQRHSLFQ